MENFQKDTKRPGQSGTVCGQSQQNKEKSRQSVRIPGWTGQEKIWTSTINSHADERRSSP